MKLNILFVMLSVAVLLSTGYSFASQGTNVDTMTFDLHPDEGTAPEELQRDAFGIHYDPVPYADAAENTEPDVAGDPDDGKHDATSEMINKEDTEIITIGALVPVSRPDGAGIHRQVATELAIEDFNKYLEASGASWRLDLDVRDTAAPSADPLDLVKSLHDDGVQFISGPSASSRVSMIKDYADANDMLIVSCCSTAPSLAFEGDNVFRMAPDDALHGPVISNLLWDNGKTVLISVWRDGPFGNGLHDSTVAKFEELGGTVDDLGSYPLCDEDNCHDAAFDALTGQLREKVQMYVDSHGSEKVAVLYVGAAETADFMQRAAAHPVLHTVNWIGSDANVLSNSLVDDPVIFQFMQDVNFTACIFAEDQTSQRYQQLNARLSADSRIVGTPNVYTYASYDSIWTLGLAIEAAGDGGFEEIKRQIPLAVSDYQGALGNIVLNDVGDSAEASYAVWGIRSAGWERIGTYVSDLGLVPVMADPDTKAEQECDPGTVMQDGICIPDAGDDDDGDDGGGCLIATAAYGSELAPQVQMLREIRDGTVMSTAAGASFMSGFNQIYYSFSPVIADAERENPIFREAVRAFIAPMLATLSIMTLADESSEAGVLGLGMAVIALNLGMYVAVPVLVGFKIHAYARSRHSQR